MRIVSKTNCPNCGAPVTGNTCPYCDTVFARPESAIALALGRKVSVSFEADGCLYEFDMVLDNVRIDADVEPTDLYSDGMLYTTIYSQPEYRASFDGRLVRSERHHGDGYLFYRDLAPDEVTR